MRSYRLLQAESQCRLVCGNSEQSRCPFSRSVSGQQRLSGSHSGGTRGIHSLITDYKRRDARSVQRRHSAKSVIQIVQSVSRPLQTGEDQPIRIISLSSAIECDRGKAVNHRQWNADLNRQRKEGRINRITGVAGDAMIEHSILHID